jgi:hypothetical protein
VRDFGERALDEGPLRDDAKTSFLEHELQRRGAINRSIFAPVTRLAWEGRASFAWLPGLSGYPFSAFLGFPIPKRRKTHFFGCGRADLRLGETLGRDHG